jgi:hypothetical protein
VARQDRRVTLTRSIAGGMRQGDVGGRPRRTLPAVETNGPRSRSGAAVSAVTVMTPPEGLAILKKTSGRKPSRQGLELRAGTKLRRDNARPIQ